MRDKIVTAVLGDDLYVKTSHVFQYDYGLTLMIDGIQLPAEYEIHFSNKKRGVAKKGELVEGGAKIPDEYLRSGDNVYAWVYIRHGDDDGYTVYSVEIPVVQRSVEQGDNITIIEHNIIDEAIAALEDAVEKTDQNVKNYPYINEENHHWMVYDAETGEFVDTGITAEGQDADPYELIDDTSGSGITNRTWSANKLVDVQNSNKTFVVNKSATNSSTPLDKTFAEIQDAYDKGQTVVIHASNADPQDPEAYAARTIEYVTGMRSNYPGTDGKPFRLYTLALANAPVVAYEYTADTANDYPVQVQRWYPAVKGVKINGQSIVENGTANIPLASASEYGAIKLDDTAGAGNTDKAWSADKIVSSLEVVPVFTDNIGTFSCDTPFADVLQAVQEKRCTSCVCARGATNKEGFAFLMAGSNSIIFYRTIDVGAAGSVTTDSIVYYSSGNISYLSDSVNVADVIGDTAGAGVTNKSWSANKLINELAKKEDKPDFVITFSDVNISAGTAIADRTPSEVITAYYEGKSIKAVYTGSTVPTEVVLRNVFESYVTFECLLFTMIYTFSGNAGENGWECYINRLLNGNLQEYWAQGSKIKYLGAPVDSTDATNKQYVDNAVGGLIDDTAGSGDTGKTWSADKIVGELGEKYEKPAGGIPATDLASAAQTSLEKADTAYQKPAGGIPATDLASGVIPDPTSIIDDTAGAGDTDRTFSADKLATDHSSLLNAINVLKPSATASDVGKALIVKTVADGIPTEFEYGGSLPDTIPTEETAQELLEQETYNTGLTGVALAVIGMTFDNLPQDETAQDIADSIALECERLDLIYDGWISERGA